MMGRIRVELTSAAVVATSSLASLTNIQVSMNIMLHAAQMLAEKARFQIRLFINFKSGLGLLSISRLALQVCRICLPYIHARISDVVLQMRQIRWTYSSHIEKTNLDGLICSLRTA